MITGILIEILIILILILANGLFSMSEMAVVSSRRARLHQSARKGDARAQAALDLAENPDRFLSTVQIGITLIGILAGAVGGATIAEQLGVFWQRIPWLAPYSEMIGVGIVVLSITYLTLVLGELIPKRLALSAPERIASAVAAPMGALSRLASPFVRILELSTAFVYKIFRIRLAPSPPITEEEIKILLEQGTKLGVFNEAEHTLVKNIFRLADQPISTLMTQRREIVWLDREAPIDSIRRKVIDSPHTYFPVIQSNLDTIEGIVRGKDLLAATESGEAVEWEAILLAPPRIVETRSALDALEAFKNSPLQVALVVDQGGAVEGLVTTQDILQGIVGEPLMNNDRAVGLAIRHEDGSWLLDGIIPLPQLKELFPLGPLPGEERGLFTTLSGFLMTQLGKIPAVGDYVDFKGFRFEIVEMDGKRVDRVRVVSLSELRLPFSSQPF